MSLPKKMSLPRFVVIKSVSNLKYLRYIHEDAECVKGSLRFSGVEAVSPYAKFQVEMATSAAAQGLVNIRCCYNNKYWQKQSEKSLQIVAGADKPDEDQSKWSCTLFEPTYTTDGANADDNKARFHHISLGRYVSSAGPNSPSVDSLYLGSTSPDNNDSSQVFEIIDWESLLVLPKHISFKGDKGMYLSAVDNLFQRFNSSDSGDPAVAYEIIPIGDGSVRIKADYNGKFWTTQRGGDFQTNLLIDSTNDYPYTLFWPIKVNNNVIALRSLSSNKFCRKYADILCANVSTISKDARLEVEEAVISRAIYNVNFRLPEARIYQHDNITMVTEDVTNNSTVANIKTIKSSYTETKSSAWNSSSSLILGTKCSLESGIPFIKEGKIYISTDQLTETYQWGETNTSTNVVESTYTVSILPMSRTKVILVATKGLCEIPFSYTHRDVLTNGKHSTYNKDDGVYTGVNYYNFQYKEISTKINDVC